MDQSRINDNDFAFVEQLFADEQLGAAIYSVPGLLLQKANKSFLKYIDPSCAEFEPYAGRAAGTLGLYGKQAEKLLTEVIKTQKVLSVEAVETETATGSICLNYTIVPVVLDGVFKYVFETSRDVTDKVRLRAVNEAREKKLTGQMEKLEAIIDTMSDQLIVIDRGGFYEFYNKAARETFDPIYGPVKRFRESKADVEYYDMDNNKVSREDLPIKRVLDGESFTRFRFKIRHREMTVMEINATPLRDETGAVVSGVLCCRDITELINSQEKLLEQNKLLSDAIDRQVKIAQELQNIVDNTDDMIFSVDAEYRIVLFNKAAENYFLANYGEQLWRGKSIRAIAHADFSARLFEMCRQAIEGGKYQVDLRALSSDHVISFAVNPVVIHGAPVEVTVYGKDVTERHHTEHVIIRENTTLELRVQERTRELQNSLKELRDLAMAISHEMKTPLREIEHYSKQIRERQDIEANSQKVIDLCRDKLDMIDKLFKYSMTSNAEISKETVNLKKMIQALHEELKADMQLRRARLDFETGLPSVIADKALIRQVLTNILSNALKFSSKRDIPQLFVGCREENGEYVFYFKDNGAGFNEKYADRLFSVFERLHTEEEFEGSGIGLAVVRSIVKRHGGRTWIRGGENSGATLYFTLPVQA